MAGHFPLDPQELAYHRGACGLTQEDLASKLDVASKTVSNWETGKTQPSYALAGRLAEEFGVPLADLKIAYDLFQLELAVQHDRRHRKVVVENEFVTFSVGEHIRVRCRPSQQCHLWIVNADARGELTTLIPNEHRLSGPMAASEWHAFPASHERYKFPILGPPGTEKIVAIALSAPVSAASLPEITKEDLQPGLKLPRQGLAAERPSVLAVESFEFEVVDKDSQRV